MKNETFLQMCANLGITAGDVSTLDHETFDSLVTVYNKGRLIGRITQVCLSKREVAYVDPSDNDRVIFTKKFRKDYVDYSEIRPFASICTEEHLEEVEQDMKSFPIKVSEDGIELLATLNSPDSKLVRMLMNGVVKGSCGAILKEDVKALLGDRNFYKRYRFLKEDSIVSDFVTGLNKKYLTYKLAPYLVYRGPDFHKEAEIQEWFRITARENSFIEDSITKALKDLPGHYQPSKLTGKMLVHSVDKDGVCKWEILTEEEMSEKVSILDTKNLGYIPEGRMNRDFCKHS